MRDASYGRVSVTPSVSVSRVLSKWLNESSAVSARSNLVLHSIFKKIRVFSKKKQKYTVLPCRILSQTLDLKTSPRHIDRQRVDTARQKWTLSVINWTVIGQLMLKLHYFDLSWICCTACCTTNSRQKSKYNGV